MSRNKTDFICCCNLLLIRCLQHVWPRCVEKSRHWPELWLSQALCILHIIMIITYVVLERQATAESLEHKRYARED